MRRRGIVRGIRRQDGEVDALVDGALVAARYNPNRMPWPLCLAVFEQYQPGSWRCVGPIGHREVLFHDDFLCVNSGTGYGDTFWTLDSGAATASANGVGCVTLSGYLLKTTDILAIPTPPRSLWFSLLIRSDVVTYGFMLDPTTGDGITFELGILDSLLLSSFDGALQDNVSGTITSASSHWLDLVLSANLTSGQGGYMSGWVDGDGPYTVHNYVSAVQAGVAVLPWVGTGSFSDSTVDCAELNVVAPTLTVPDAHVGQSGSGVGTADS